MRTFIVVLFIFLTKGLNAQKNTYIADLEKMKSILQNSASFKAQIKGDKLSSFNALYDELASDGTNTLNSYNYFYNLSRLVFPLRDNHIAFYQIPDYNLYKSKQSIDSFVSTKEFLDYPTRKINIDSLKVELAKKPADSLEGIYHYENFYSVGLFKNAEKEYVGVIVDSEVNLWKKGQIAIHLYEYAPNLYKAIYGHPLYKFFTFQPIEKFQNHQLVNSYFYASYSQSIYSKHWRQADHVSLPKSASKFVLRNISDDVQYLLIQTFQANSNTSQASKQFFDSIKDSLITSHLILDLRNNEGGAEKEMIKYLKLLKVYITKGHLYVLVNNGTLSQAEIFTLRLRELNNVTILGRPTKGMLAYGSNYGKTQRLPSEKFAIYATDMNNGSALLQHEDTGINPDILLSYDRNWIEQIVEIIKNK